MKGMDVFRSFGLYLLLSWSIAVPLRGQIPPDHKEGGQLAEGLNLRLDGQYAEAVQFFQSRFDTALSEGKNRTQLECGMNLGYLYWNMGQMDRSRTFFKEAHYLSHVLGLKMEWERSRVSLAIYDLYQKGKQQRREGRFEPAIHSFEKAISLAQDIRSREHELKCTRQLSLVYMDMNQWDRYLQLNTAGLALAETLNHRIEKGRALNNIGHYYWRIRDYPQALGFFQQALELAEKQDQFRDQAVMLNNIGVLYKEFGRIDRALDYQMMAMELNVDKGTGLDRAIGLNNIGNTYSQRAAMTGERADLFYALFYYLECLDLSRELGSAMVEMYVLNNMASIYSKLGRLERAERALREGIVKARAAGDREALAMLLANLGAVLLDQGLPGRAEEPLREAQILAGAVNNHRVVWETLFNMGRFFEMKGFLAEALDYYRRAVQIIQTVRRGLLLDVHQAGFMQTEGGAFDALLWLLYRLWRSGRVPGEVVFDVVEQAKARGFLDVMTLARNGILRNIEKDFSEKEAQISSRITQSLLSLCDPHLTALESRNIKNRLRRTEEEYEGMFTLHGLKNRVSFQSAPCSLGEIRRFLPDEATAVAEYYCGRERSYLVFFSRAEFDIRVLPGRESLVDLLRGYLKCLQEPGGGVSGREAAWKLGQKLASPLMGGPFPGFRHLVVVPDGILHALPFDTLALDPSGAPLIQRMTISYSPSSSSLIHLAVPKSRGYAGKRALIFGSRDLASLFAEGDESRHNLKTMYLTHGFDFSSLPDIDTEVRNVSGSLVGMERDVFLSVKASEEAFKGLDLSVYGIIHFASHSFTDNQNPMSSALILGRDQSRREDGFLQAREIQTLNLNADLVVMAGCRTGTGPAPSPEGMVGLPRVFFYAGARSVVSALWPVDDRASAQFMRLFYALLGKGVGVSEALRLAKMEMQKSPYRHPFFWAGYVLYGDPQWPGRD
jgi:tetratricopeptide (TPR) repeat protein